MVQSTMAGEDVSIRQKPDGEATRFNEYFVAAILTALVTAASFVLQPLTGHAALALLYLLLVVIAGVKLRRGPVLFVAASSALLWDYLINPPYLSFLPTNLEDMLFFAMFFVVAIAMGHLTSQIRLKELRERMREQRTAALYELVQQAGLAPDLDNGLRAAIGVTETLFGVRAALLLHGPDDVLGAETHPASSFPLDEKEYRVASWAFIHNTPAGKFTDNLADSAAMHLPLRARTAALGILSILPPPGKSLELAERDLLEAFAVLIATILERDRLNEGLKTAEIIKGSERLQRALVRSFSHELKTPLAAVQAGIEAFHREAGGSRSQAAWSESQHALRRLRRVINNLLDMSRIESHVVHPNLDWCDVAELTRAATDLAAEGIVENPVVLELDANLPLVRADQPLLEQCLCNLLLNAAANCIAGAKIIIRARVADGHLFLCVLDEGCGISDADLPRIFGAFQRGAASTPGGTGLGLAIVEGFVQAHGGTISAANRPVVGAEFTMRIPVETLKPEVLETLA